MQRIYTRFLLLGLLSSPTAFATALQEQASASTQLRSQPTPLSSQMATIPVVGEHRVMVVVGQWQNAKNVDPTVIRQQLFSSDARSLRSYVRAASANQLTLNEYRLLTPDFGNKPAGNCTNDDIYGRAQKAISAAGIAASDYDQLVVAVMCQGGANASMPGKQMMLFGQGDSSHVFLHEYGHNLGFSHPQAYQSCSVNGHVLQAPNGCAVTNGTDSGDPVGGGSGLYPAINRAFAGWLNDAQHGQINASGVYKLGVLGGAGPQLFTLRREQSNQYITLEQRGVNPPYDFAAGDNRNQGIWVRYATVGGYVTSVQLNANPANTALTTPTLLPGKELVDNAAGVHIRVCPSTGTGRVFTVGARGEPAQACPTVLAVPTLNSPASDQVVTLSPVYAGRGIPGATVRIHTERQTYETLVDAQGRWRYGSGERLAAGRHTFSVSQALDAQVVSKRSPERAFTVQHASLPVSQLVSPAPGAQVGRYPVIAGSATPGASIVVGKSYDGRVLARTVADEQGKWSTRILERLPLGDYAVSTRQSLAGSTSSWGDNVKFKVVSSVATPVFQQPATGARVVQGNVVVTGTARPGAVVHVVPRGKPQTLLAVATADAQGRWETLITSGLPLGNNAISSKAFDQGAQSSWSENRSFVVVAP